MRGDPNAATYPPGLSTRRSCSPHWDVHRSNAWPADSPSLVRQVTLRRWYGFIRMQMRVAAQLPRIVTVSQSSARDITAQMGVPADRLHVVPVGVDHTVFRPMAGTVRDPLRIMTTASSDVPLKGLVPLLEALAKVRTELPVELVVIGKHRKGSKIPATLAARSTLDKMK